MVRRILTTYFHSADSELALELRNDWSTVSKGTLSTIHDCYSARAEDYKKLCAAYKKKAKEVLFDRQLSNKIDLSDPELEVFRLELIEIEKVVQKNKKNPA